MATPKKKSKKRTGLEAATLGSLKNANLRTLGNQAWLTRTQLARKMNPRLLNLMNVSRLANVPGGALGALGLSLGAGALIGKHMESNTPISNFQSARGAGRQAFPGPGRESMLINPESIDFSDGQAQFKNDGSQFALRTPDNRTIFKDPKQQAEYEAGLASLNTNLTTAEEGATNLDENNPKPVPKQVEKQVTQKVKDQLSIKNLERKGMSLQRGIQGRKWRNKLEELKMREYDAAGAVKEPDGKV